VAQASATKQLNFASQAEQETGLSLSPNRPIYRENMDLTRPVSAKGKSNE